MEETRVGGTAEDHARDGEGSVVGIFVVHLQRHPDQEKRVLLVGRFDLVVDRFDLGVSVGDALVAAGALPVAEEFGDQLLHLRRVELAADDDLAFAGAVELLVEVAHVVERHLLQVFDLFVEGGGVPHVAALVSGVHVPVKSSEARLFGSVLALSAPAMRCWRICSNSASGNDGLAQQFPRETQRVGQVRLQGANARRSEVDAAGDADLRLQAVGFILDLLAVLVLGAAHQQRARP